MHDVGPMNKYFWFYISNSHEKYLVWITANLFGSTILLYKVYQPFNMLQSTIIVLNMYFDYSDFLYFQITTIDLSSKIFVRASHMYVQLRLSLWAQGFCTKNWSFKASFLFVIFFIGKNQKGSGAVDVVRMWCKSNTQFPKNFSSLFQGILSTKLFVNFNKLMSTIHILIR